MSDHEFLVDVHVGPGPGGHLRLYAKCSGCDGVFWASGDVYRYASDDVDDPGYLTFVEVRFWIDEGDELCAAQAAELLRSMFRSHQGRT